MLELTKQTSIIYKKILYKTSGIIYFHCGHSKAKTTESRGICTLFIY